MEREATGGVATPELAATTTRVDWEAAVRDPAFQQLMRSRRRFVVPATIGAVGWLLLWLVLLAYAPDFMGSSLYSGLTVGYALGLSQYALAWIIAWRYLRKSRREWMPLRRRSLERLERDGGVR